MSRPVRVLNDRQIDSMAGLRAEGSMTYNECALFDTVLDLRAKLAAATAKASEPASSRPTLIGEQALQFPENLAG